MSRHASRSLEAEAHNQAKDGQEIKPETIFEKVDDLVRFCLSLLLAGNQGIGSARLLVTKEPKL
jgi:hypothetical protein